MYILLSHLHSCVISTWLNLFFSYIQFLLHIFSEPNVITHTVSFPPDGYHFPWPSNRRSYIALVCPSVVASDAPILASFRVIEKLRLDLILYISNSITQSLVEVLSFAQLCFKIRQITTIPMYFTLKRSVNITIAVSVIVFRFGFFISKHYETYVVKWKIGQKLENFSKTNDKATTKFWHNSFFNAFQCPFENCAQPE